MINFNEVIKLIADKLFYIDMSTVCTFILSFAISFCFISVAIILVDIVRAIPILGWIIIFSAAIALIVSLVSLLDTTFI